MDQNDIVPGIRAASRELVRHWGFLGKSVAGTDMSGSATHAIVEIGRNDGLSARDLSQRLRLEKSTISRLVKSLVARGEIRETPSREDGRAKHLSLTAQGRRSLADIDRFAETQVVHALDHLDDQAQRHVLTGLTDYARALGQVADPGGACAPEIRIQTGYCDGLIGDVAALCARRIQCDYPFGHAFEAKIARELSEFIGRADAPQNGIWHARAAGQMLGSITIDGDNLGDGRAHLRWFAVKEAASGSGIGKTLLRAALDHCDRQGFAEIHLWTLRGLDAARSLYEREGFTLAEEFPGDQCGAEVAEQRFERRHPSRH